jgi:hypothetical protein
MISRYAAPKWGVLRDYSVAFAVDADNEAVPIEIPSDVHQTFWEKLEH